MHDASSTPPHEWQKILWKKQPFPDNHLPPSFLSSLQRNINLKQYTYPFLFKTVLPVTQHLSNTALFLSTFARLKTGRLDPRVLVYLGSVLSILGYGIYELSCPRWGHHRLAQALKSSILVFLALASLAPVLRTLTAATSDDSIWALAAGLFILHTVLADYTPERVRVVRDRMDGESQGGLTSVLSINAAVSASVVLASRLQTDIAVFSLMLYAVQSFALLPVLRQRLQVRSSFHFYAPTNETPEIPNSLIHTHMLRNRPLTHRSTLSYPRLPPRNPPGPRHVWFTGRPSMEPEIQKSDKRTMGPSHPPTQRQKRLTHRKTPFLKQGYTYSTHTHILILPTQTSSHFCIS
ncbi:phosphatidylinositol N-acetylglucosaminyltransferase subunit C [Rhizoctonia solani AG-3 Rhs1AP]|uniref:Phosphatidylinositol N-acetylglucosaminyltransferase n=2 Tax=Rhizoctonia solani AG-3 TaxID=1086053 RepID=A0A074RY13_9AGAM|nr:phosphatidylinositol N-acetylglucosaminyltransferase subunit C [Rhizoctonia solani AG-3 Rhs1AP]KEP49523.1 phosphatidylinositol N-acetylglucosaminyltransferase [Rhizoctonia solani 123E]